MSQKHLPGPSIGLLPPAISIAAVAVCTVSPSKAGEQGQTKIATEYREETHDLEDASHLQQYVWWFGVPLYYNQDVEI